jgi:hypothetical protein
VRYYSIKHIATKGIVEFDGEPIWEDRHVRQTQADAKREGNRWNCRLERIGTECFDDIGEARNAAIQKLKRKREALSKQSRKVTDMIGKLVAEDMKL